MKSVFIVVAGLLLSSCVSDKIEPINNDLTSKLDCGTAVYSFSMDIQPIFINSCATTSCHSSSTNAGGFITETYSEISSNDVLFLKTIKQEAGVIAMPFYAPKLDDSLILKIECWMADGSPDN